MIPPIRAPRSPWGFTIDDLYKAAAEGANLQVTADHMCPDCGNPPAPFCSTCSGRGVVTGLQLSIWQRKEDAKIAGGPR